MNESGLGGCYQRLLEHLNTEEMHRRSELQRDRDDRHQAYLDYDKNVKWYPGFRNNQSGVKYNIITKKPTDEYEEKRVNAEAMKARQEINQNTLRIYRLDFTGRHSKSICAGTC